MNHTCIICNCILSIERLEALQVLDKQPFEYTCLSCAVQNDFKIKAVYQGLSGISPMIFCKDIKNDKITWETNEVDNFTKQWQETNIIEPLLEKE